MLYIAREGEEGFYNRLKAYISHFLEGVDLDALPFKVITVPVNLGPTEKGEHVDKIIATIKEMNEQHPDQPVGNVVYDNLRAVAPGLHEGYAEEIEAFYAKVRAVAVATGAAPTILDNTGKDTDRGARGTQAKFDLPDTVIEVESNNGSRAFVVLKVRDGLPGARFGFRLDDVQLGCVADVDGEPKDIASAIVVPVDAKPKATKKNQRRLTDKDKKALDVFEYVSNMHGVADQPLGRDGKLVRTVAKDLFVTAYCQSRATSTPTRSASRPVDASSKRSSASKFSTTRSSPMTGSCSGRPDLKDALPGIGFRASMLQPL